jgi:hypothetical protein
MRPQGTRRADGFDALFYTAGRDAKGHGRVFDSCSLYEARVVLADANRVYGTVSRFHHRARSQARRGFHVDEVKVPAGRGQRH